VRSSTGVHIQGFTLIPWSLEGVICGILINPNCDNCIITNNVIANFTHGIPHGGPAPPTTGIFIEYSNSCSVFHNDFINNGFQAEIFEASRTSWDDGFHGNYWSDYTGWDNNRNGIGDIPYQNIYDLNRDNVSTDVDHYPAMSPYYNAPLPMYTLNISTTAGGTTVPPPSTYIHYQGQKIPVRANPANGYVFDHWELDNVTVASVFNPMDVMMNLNRSLLAVFTPSYDVTIEAHCNTEEANVNLSLNEDGLSSSYVTPHIFAGLTDMHNFTVPDQDASGHAFRRWNIGESDTTIAVDSSGTYIAYYDVKYPMIITQTSGGSTDPPPSVYLLWSGTAINVTATPDTGYYLDHWELDNADAGMLDIMSVTMNTNHTLLAVFKPLTQGDDVTIKYISSKTIVGQGYPVLINVTAMNIGVYPETFNVTVYVNSPSVMLQSVALKSVTLKSGQFATLTFGWSTAGFPAGNYTISAYAWPVPGENNTDDNSLTGGTVYVGVPGDVSGDHKVDVVDLLMVAKAFGSNSHSPTWNPNTDVNGDNKADIIDLLITAKNYGKTDP
jgi:hypothetical protein